MRNLHKEKNKKRAREITKRKRNRINPERKRLKH